MLLAVQMEKLRVEEALAARDNVVAHLEDAYVSVRQKATTILRLEQELEVFKRASTPANTNSSGFEIVLEPPGTPRSDPGQVFEELAETRASIVVYSVVRILTMGWNRHKGIQIPPEEWQVNLQAHLTSLAMACKAIRLIVDNFTSIALR